MSGIVSQSTGQATTGATIKATHMPSGTVYAGSANSAGRFSLANMRVGGPYRIEVTYVGQAALTYDDIYLQLGQPFVLNPVFGSTATSLDEVKVTASNKGRGVKTGAETFISRTQLENLPTVSRSIQDFTRLTPQADLKGSSISIGGVNNRFNQFTVDGAVSNDVFGLNASGMNGGSTNTNPVSLDAIDQITVQIAPFDVRSSGFAGGGVSAVTRSGTNKVEGSVYYYTRNQNLTGKTPKYLVKEGEEATRLEDFTEKQYGVRLGGPIVKDKLFFFANYERTESNTPLNYPVGASGSNLTIADADQLFDIAKNVYGYDPGSYANLANTNESNKIFGRLDWNINQKHKFSIRYGYTEADDLSNYRNGNSVTFANGGTLKKYKNNTFTAELNSRFTNSLSNNLVVGFNKVSDRRGFNGDLFPRISVKNTNGTYNLGTDAVANVNELDQDILTLTNNLTWYKGVHTLTFGTHNEFYSMSNAYINNSNGAYNFADSPVGDVNPATGVPYTAIENFARGKATSYNSQYSNTDNPRQAAAFKAMQLGFYVQDEYQMHDNFKITAGVRVDIPIYNDVPMENTDFNNSILAKMYNVQTNSMPSAKLMFSPRVGFNWDVNADRSTVVRGGVGIFTSRFPFVWASGAFTQNGALLGGHSLGNGVASTVDFVADPNNQPKFGGTFAPSGNISVLDKDLKLPQIARFSAGLDQELPWGIKGTLEFMYSKNLSAFRFTDLNLERPTGTLEGADNRLVYDPNNNARRVLDNYSEVIYIDNVSKGYSWSTTASLAKNFGFGLNASLAYTYTESKDLTSGTSSQNQSNFYRVSTVNGSNNATLAHSPFSTGSRVVGVVSFSREYIKHLGTNISIIYNGQSGPRYSYLTSGNLIGYASSTSNQYQLMYIPKDQSEITFVQNGAKTPQQQWDELNSFIDSDKYLKSRKGKYAERNGARMPFSHQFDLKIAQDLFTNIGNTKNKLQLSIDIMNVGNLISSSWGKQFDGSHSFWDNSFKPVNFAGYEAGTKKPTYRLNNLNGNVPYYYRAIESRWSAQVGVRYIFN